MSFQAENRLQDDMSGFAVLVLKPGGYYRFSKLVNLGVGLKTMPNLRVEVGYLWRYQRERIGENRNDHVLRLQFLFDTKGRHLSHGGS